VPGNRSLDLYIAVAFQEAGYLAVTLGEVTTVPVSRPESPSSTPTPTPTPVAVPRPNRVEAGAGGAAPADGPAGLVALAGLVGIGGVLLHRRLATR